MSRFASGKNAYAISDRSGFRYRKKDMRKEWNGLLVGNDEFEKKHPQLEPIHVKADPQAIKNPRPDRTEPPVEVLLQRNPFLTDTIGSNILTVTEPGDGRKTGDVVRFKNVQLFQNFTPATLNLNAGYSITVTTDSQYTIAVNAQTATEANSKGGGSNASAGPITVEA